MSILDYILTYGPYVVAAAAIGYAYAAKKSPEKVAETVRSELTKALGSGETLATEIKNQVETMRAPLTAAVAQLPKTRSKKNIEGGAEQ